MRPAQAGGDDRFALGDVEFADVAGIVFDPEFPRERPICGGPGQQPFLPDRIECAMRPLFCGAQLLLQSGQKLLHTRSILSFSLDLHST